MKEKQIVLDLFLRDKPAKILLGLKTSRDSVYVTLLSKEADCTYAHTMKILNFLHELGIVKFEKKGRIKRVILTETGWDIANGMEAFFKKIIQLEKNLKKSQKKPRKRK